MLRWTHWMGLVGIAAWGTSCTSSPPAATPAPVVASTPRPAKGSGFESIPPYASYPRTTLKEAKASVYLLPPPYRDNPWAAAAAGSAVRLGGPRGPIISVTEHPLDSRVFRVLGAHAEIELDGWRPLLRGRTINAALTGWVALSTLTPMYSKSKRPQTETNFPPPKGRVRAGLSRPISAAPGEAPFTRSRCWDLHVLEEKGDFMRVRQSRYYVSIVGWMPRARGDASDVECTPEVIDARKELGVDISVAPSGYVLAGDPAPVLARFFREGATVHWLVDEEGRYSCLEWDVEPGDHDQVAFLQQRDFDSDGRRLRYQLRLKGSDLTIVGPRSQRVGVKVILIKGCGWVARFVDVEQDALLAVPSNDYDAERPLAYRRAATHSWFLTAAACEKSVRVANSPEAAAVETLGVVPKGCS